MLLQLLAVLAVLAASLARCSLWWVQWLCVCFVAESCKAVPCAQPCCHLTRSIPYLVLLPLGLRAELQRRQGVLCWQAGMLGAALHWLAACGDVQRIDTCLQPLADAVSAGRVSAEQQAALQALQPMLQSLPPGSSNCTLLDVHRLLTSGGDSSGGVGGGVDGGGMHAAVAALVQLPEGMRDSCLQLVCGVLPTLPPGQLSEPDVLFLLQWLLVGASSYWHAFGGSICSLTGGRTCLAFCSSAALSHTWLALPLPLQSAEGRLPAGKRGAALAAAIMTARLTLVRSLAGSHMRQQAAGVRV
jgi:hypothetical protein